MILLTAENTYHDLNDFSHMIHMLQTSIYQNITKLLTPSCNKQFDFFPYAFLFVTSCTKENSYIILTIGSFLILVGLRIFKYILFRVVRSLPSPKRSVLIWFSFMAYLELWGVRRRKYHFVNNLPSSFWLGVVVSLRVTSVCRIDLLEN